MKKLITLAVLAAFVIGFATTASAIVDVKASGQWRVAAVWGTDFDMMDNHKSGNTQEAFDVHMRARTAFQFIANENLRGVWQIEIGTATWGQDSVFDVGSKNAGLVETRQLYVDFTVPNTEVQVTAGFMPLALPSGALGSPILDDQVAAVAVSAPLMDGVGLLAGWGRAFDLASGNDALDDSDDSLDMFFAAVPMSFDWLSLTPYFVYGYGGDNFVDNGGGAIAGLATVGNGTITADSDSSVWFLGLAGSLDFDPFVIDAHAVYGALATENDFTDRAGWEADIALTYTGFDFVTPQLWFAWTSGEDDNGSDEDGSERLPTISDGMTPGNFYYGGGIITDGVDSIHGGSVGVGMGFWGLGLNLTDISFVENLTHALGIAYFEGTNDKRVGSAYVQNGSAATGNTMRGNAVQYGLTLTEEDSLVEYYFGTDYQMYDQLVLMFKAAYLDVDMDDATWSEISSSNGDADASIVEIGLEYSF